jgi:serine-type D-Ala-D-Ala carboxypeptidase/endopeptidase
MNKASDNPPCTKPGTRGPDAFAPELTRRQALAGLCLGACPGVALAQAAAPAAPSPAASSASSPMPSAAPSTPLPLANMQPLLQERLRHEGVGMVAAQWQRAEEPRYAQAGSRHVLQVLPPDANTLFEIGSVSKTFVALLLADMVVRRELHLDAAVEEALPSGLKLRDAQGAPLRWVDLATHRSGLPRLPPAFNPAVEADPYADYTQEMLWAFVADWRAERKRDTKWDYSNLGYGLLAEALARRAGGSFQAVLSQRVLLPMGLADMRLRMQGQPVQSPNIAFGHDDQRRAVPAWQFQAMAGAGALLASATSLMRYARCMVGDIDHPLREAAALALEPRAAGPAPRMRSALAWLRGRSPGGLDFATHDGGTYGFSSSLFIAPEAGRASLVLANSFTQINDLAMHGLDARARLRDVAAEAAARQAATQRQPVLVAAEALQALAGSYALEPQFKLRVRADGQRLFAQATGQGEFELFAVNEREFFARVAPIDIRFEGATGVAPALLLKQSGQTMRFVRE